MHLNVVDFPLPLNPNKPNFSFDSNPKFKFLTALMLFPQQIKYVFDKFIIFVVRFLFEITFSFS